MSFDSLQAFIAMDGHGPYVWASYALALGVVLFIIVAPLRRRRSFLREQAGRLRRAGIDGSSGGGAPESTGRPAPETP